MRKIGKAGGLLALVAFLFPGYLSFRGNSFKVYETDCP
jgi:hypothetical protein